MHSLERVVLPAPFPVSAASLWRATLLLVCTAAFIIARACGFDFGSVLNYTIYFALYVLLPGTVALYFVQRAPVSLAKLFALAMPTGFAIEIFTYLGLSALHAKLAYLWTPLAWLALAIAIRMSRGEWVVRIRTSANHAGIFLGLVAAFLCVALTAAGQMFAESPLTEGLPARAIFHDWVYLVSRAAVIKNHWPLDDPSLAGTPLQYHYFMMVHAAASSWITGVELTAVMLRLMYVPLGAALVAQSYLLGRALSRSAWGGVVAALLTTVASEVSFARSYGEPMFLGLFGRWIFVSPTFFFGMIFCGALLIAVGQCARLRTCAARHWFWLLLLATAGTGAKGTVLPVIIAALGVWIVWRCASERRIPWRLVGFGLCLGIGFIAVYLPTMSSWRTGDAAFRPLHVFQLTGFWKTYLPVMRDALATWLPVSFATPLATLACAVVVFAGTAGVRLLAIPYLLWGDRRKRDPLLVGWLGAFFLVSAGMGLLMELNSYGELYLILMMRVPMAVLAAAFVVWIARKALRWWRLPGEARLPLPLVSDLVWCRRACLVALTVVVVTSAGLQTSVWWKRNHSGLANWWSTPVDLQPDEQMQDLREALLWVRNHTERNAVLVANAYTPENMKKDHWGALDRTLMGVHFYYSALSERRLWFEGPNYVMDATRVRLRASLASNFFYRNRPLPASLVSNDPTYVLLDLSLGDGAHVGGPGYERVFVNPRIEIYRLAARATPVALVATED